jgi:hypothetical protein
MGKFQQKGAGDRTILTVFRSGCFQGLFDSPGWVFPISQSA